ncbi:Signal transducer regulating beta-lactamase production, contains metallopeptidase domain [Flavobacterium aquidurense]|uniref:Peptidase M56 n=1 Tax=Flavobacterium frigidimaris TaxID=262320 RepID=A0ABX4BUX1_FLAFR|nr:M56 family metallopeptidase [Flavobacterium frigidimaris]OXA81705.1 peptidase M56 [Flavobacterium frigidimaris]SDZ54567.1 Signal transducer regulating beta-lactamase production, contains metallopeptidase domain [Flavobacterium aquidurense]
MEALFIYIAKSAGLVILFYCAYFFLLRKETFFNSNRWFLLTGLITSALLPLAVYTKVIWVNPTPLSNLNYSSLYSAQIEKDAFEINWSLILLALYGLGVLVLLIKFAFDFYSLNSILKGKQIKQQADFKFVDINENIAPFSYFEYIVYNSSMYTASELESILEHEKVHSDQNHTMDVLISRAFSILFWFNPVIWLYKKAIIQNLEFIADAAAAQKISDKKAYQYTLLKITTHESCLSITNHFYQSLIKKRIVMLNKNQSKKRNSWKLCLIIPALVAFVLLFQIEVIAKEKGEISKKEVNKKESSLDVYKISKTTTDQELKEMAEKMKLNHNVDAKVSDIERNSNNELTAIRFDLKRGSEQSQSYRVKGSTAIKNCEIVIETEKDGSKKIGLKTDNENGNVKVINKEHKIKINKVVNSNINSNAETTDNTNTNISTNTSTTTNVNTDINTDENTNVKVGLSKDLKNPAKMTNSISITTKGNGNPKPLIIIDGEIVYDVDIKDLDSDNIKSIHVYKDSELIKKYGDEGKNGVIIIETK